MVNIDKYADALCFSSFGLSQDGNNLFYLWEKDDSTNLFKLDLNSESDLKVGLQISNYNFSSCFYMFQAFDELRKKVYFLMDEGDRQKLNLWMLDIESKLFKKITTLANICDVSFDKQFSTCWFKSNVDTDKGKLESLAYEINLDTYEVMCSEKKINPFEIAEEVVNSQWEIRTNSDEVIKLIHKRAIFREIELTSYPANELEHSVSRSVTYQSYDGKEVSAVLKMPKGKIIGAVVQAFHGGSEKYSLQAQLYAEMGIAFLSPAPRRSWSGNSDEELNELNDIIWGAKYLKDELGIKEKKIGLTGFSYGGYIVLKAITQSDDFSFGFAISRAGFADVKPFYDNQIFKAWAIDKFGVFSVKRCREVSPLHYFEKLNTPILLINGKDDAAVPFDSISKFITKLELSNKEYSLLIHESRPHFKQNREIFIKDLDAEVNFLNKYL